MYELAGRAGCRNLIKPHLHALLLDLKAGVLSAANQQVFTESLWYALRKLLGSVENSGAVKQTAFTHTVGKLVTRKKTHKIINKWNRYYQVICIRVHRPSCYVIAYGGPEITETIWRRQELWELLPIILPQQNHGIGQCLVPDSNLSWQSNSQELSKHQYFNRGPHFSKAQQLS